MNKLELSLNPDDLSSAASRLLDFSEGSRIFLFEAEMGAGKTTFIKALCRQLGSKDHFSSPTYSLINQYLCPAGPLYHLDLYRIRTQDELLDLGVEEILDSGAYCFIEWPEMIRDLVGDNYVEVKIKVAGTQRLLLAETVSR